jgi:hypothetical protein
LNKVISDDAANSPDICYETEKVKLQEKIKEIRLAEEASMTTPEMTTMFDTSTLNSSSEVINGTWHVTNGTMDTNETDCNSFSLLSISCLITHVIHVSATSKSYFQMMGFVSNFYRIIRDYI